MQNFKNLYNELAGILSGIESVQWIDLWNSQVYSLDQQQPFPAPAVFLAFRSNNITDLSDKVQKVTMQVDVFLFYETFAETYSGSYNKIEALNFLDTIDAINNLLHGSSGTEYSSMRRQAFSPVDTGGVGNLWCITYNCELIDYSAQPEWQEGSFGDVEVHPKEKFIIID